MPRSATVLIGLILVSALAGCTSGPSSFASTADRLADDSRCVTRPTADGGKTMSCSLWERTTTKTTTTLPNGQTVTTVEHTKTGD